MIRGIPLALGAAMLPFPALGQVAPGKFDVGTSQVAQNMLSVDMGRCVVGRDRRGAIAFALASVGDHNGQAVSDRLKPALINCLKGQRSATLDGGYLRGGIAEALLDENDRALLVAAGKLPPRPPVRLAGEMAEPVVAVMGCAAAAQPSDAATMLTSPPASLAEAAAFRTLIPSLQACAPASGEIRFSAARMRPATATAMFRLVSGR